MAQRDYWDEAHATRRYYRACEILHRLRERKMMTFVPMDKFPLGVRSVSVWMRVWRLRWERVLYAAPADVGLMLLHRERRCLRLTNIRDRRLKRLAAGLGPDASWPRPILTRKRRTSP